LKENRQRWAVDKITYTPGNLKLKKLQWGEKGGVPEGLDRQKEKEGSASSEAKRNNTLTRVNSTERASLRKMRRKGVSEIDNRQLKGGKKGSREKKRESEEGDSSLNVVATSVVKVKMRERRLMSPSRGEGVHKYDLLEMTGGRKGKELKKSWERPSQGRETLKRSKNIKCVASCHLS